MENKKCEHKYSTINFCVKCGLTRREILELELIEAQKELRKNKNKIKLAEIFIASDFEIEHWGKCEKKFDKDAKCDCGLDEIYELLEVIFQENKAKEALANG